MVEPQLLDDINEWREVPSIVRLSIKSLSDVIQKQGEKLTQLEHKFYASRLEDLQEKRSKTPSKFHSIDKHLKPKQSIEEQLEQKCRQMKADLLKEIKDNSGENEDLHRKIISIQQENLSKYENIYRRIIEDMQKITDHKLKNFEEEFEKAKFEINKLGIDLKEQLIQKHHALNNQHNSLKTELIDSKHTLRTPTHSSRFHNIAKYPPDVPELSEIVEKTVNEWKNVLYAEISESIRQIAESKLDIEEFCHKFSAQAIINEALCSENCVARWLWKENSLNSNLVPWNIESVNTCPENFRWIKNDPVIVTVTPGLYQLQYAFYSTTKPTVFVLVNGEHVISQAAKAHLWVNHSSGNVVGLAGNHFLALPENARLSFSVIGVSSAQGFCGLKKL